MAESLVTDWLADYEVLDPKEIRAFATQHEHNHEITSALFTIINERLKYPDVSRIWGFGPAYAIILIGGAFISYGSYFFFTGITLDLWSIVQLLSFEWAGTQAFHTAIHSNAHLHILECSRNGWQEKLPKRRNIAVGRVQYRSMHRWWPTTCDIISHACPSTSVRLSRREMFECVRSTTMGGKQQQGSELGPIATGRIDQCTKSLENYDGRHVHVQSADQLDTENIAVSFVPHGIAAGKSRLHQIWPCTSGIVWEWAKQRCCQTVDTDTDFNAIPIGAAARNILCHVQWICIDCHSNSGWHS